MTLSRISANFPVTKLALAAAMLLSLAASDNPLAMPASPDLLERRDLVVLDAEQRPALAAAGLPVIFKGARFFLAEWTPEVQLAATGAGIPFETILPWIEPAQELYIFEFHDGEEVPPEWTARVLYRNGRSVIVPIDAGSVETWTAAGYHAIAVPRVPRDWKPAYEASSLVPFSCAFNATIDGLLQRTNQTQWVDWIEKFSGEEPVVIAGTSYVVDTRYSNSMGSSLTNAKGLELVIQQVQSWHYPGANVEQDSFNSGGVNSKNIIVTIPGQTTPSEIVVASAHYDSISGSATNTTNAPGANDNGTGSATIYEALRLFRQYRFQRTIKLILFTGEEQGLIGSAAYTADHSMAGYVGVVNMDMFGYDGNLDNCMEIHIGTLPQSLDVGNCFNASLTEYSLGLSRDFLTSGATDRSDHASFWNVNVGAIELAENFFNDAQAGGCVGQDANPGYHTVNDNLPGGNLMPSFGFKIAKAALATTAAMAVPISACFASAPTLTATPAPSSVDLSWPAVAGAATYRVYRSTTGCTGQWFEIASTAATSANDATAVSGTTYAYYVEAVHADGFCASAASNCAQAAPAVFHAAQQGVTITDTCPSAGPGNHNGILEPGEVATLPITLTNDGTIGLSSVSGTFSITTPGVTVTDGAASWPNIGIGASAVSNPNHVSVSVAQSVPCGTNLANSLLVTYSGGSNSATLPLAVGPTVESLLVDANFSSGLPAGWSIVDGGVGGGVAATWTTANPGSRVIGAPFSNPFAIVDSDRAGNSASQDEQLISGTINASSCSSAFLDFDNQFRRFTGALNETADVDVSTNGGGAWTNVLRMQGSGGDNGYPTPNSKSINITSAISPNPSNVKIRFRYYNAQFEYWWAIDNVKLRCLYTVCNVCPLGPPPPGEPQNLTVQRVGGNLLFNWTNPPGGCGAATYGLYRGDLNTLRTSGYSHATALTCAAAGPGVSVPLSHPSFGTADYFLVTATSSTQEGSYGKRSSGIERPVSGAACKGAQNLNACGP